MCPHMGRVAVEGNQAAEWLDSMLTRQVVDLPVCRARYTLITGVASEEDNVQLDGAPVILDDALVTRPCRSEGRIPAIRPCRECPAIGSVSSAGFRLVLPPEGVTLNDTTEDSAMIAVQGPLVFGHTAEDVFAGPLGSVFWQKSSSTTCYPAKLWCARDRIKRRAGSREPNGLHRRGTELKLFWDHRKR